MCVCYTLHPIAISIFTYSFCICTIHILCLTLSCVIKHDLNTETVLLFGLFLSLVFQGNSGLHRTQTCYFVLFRPICCFLIIKLKAATGQLRQQEESIMQIAQYLHNALRQEYAN